VWLKPLGDEIVELEPSNLIPQAPDRLSVPEWVLLTRMIARAVAHPVISISRLGSSHESIVPRVV